MPDTHGVVRAGLSGITRSVVLLTGLAMLAQVGCSQYPRETGYADQCKTQLQFFAPPGAAVSVKGCPPRSHQVATYGAFGNRLEQSPEEFAVFNLSPGRYEFKYVAAEGLPGASVYGELNIEYANSQIARIFQRRAFIPVALPSEYYKQVEVAGNETFPYRGEVYRTAIDELDLHRLQQGDVVEKVFFVADLERVARIRDNTLRDLKVIERKMEYAEARFRNAYMDFRVDVHDPGANFWGTDKRFIEWEKRRQELSLEYQKAQDRLKRVQAVLKGDHVLIRKGMLVLATEEVVASHRDVVKAAEELGEVLLVMRIGGRHMDWSDPSRELAANP